MIVKVLSMWHSAPYMLNQKYLACTDFTPVQYEGGSGTYCIMGYITTKTADLCAVVLDSSFTVDSGDPPGEDIPIFCDAIKEKIQIVLDKTLSILELECRMDHYDTNRELIVDTMDDDPRMPQQLKVIQTWINKKMIVDYNAKVGNGEDMSVYFTQSSPSELILFLRNVDLFCETANRCLFSMQETVDNLDKFPKDAIPALKEAFNDLGVLAKNLDNFRYTYHENLIRMEGKENEDGN